MKKTVLTLFSMLLFVSIFSQDMKNYQIMLKDKRYVRTNRAILKDEEKYVIESDSGKYLIIYRNEIAFASPYLEGLPTRQVQTPGTLIDIGSRHILLGIGIGIVGTTTTLLLPIIAPSTSKWSGYIGMGTGLISLGLNIDGFSKISKAGKMLDAKKL